MYEILFDTLSKKISPTEEEKEFCKTVFVPRKIKRKQYLLHQGDVCRFTSFVTKGCLRSYSIDAKGSERIVQFAIEGWWIGDMYSYLTGEPAPYNIEALEDTEILLMDIEGKEQLMSKYPKFERYFRILLELNYVATHRRLLQAISNTAEERYTAFATTYPEIVQRVPQHMIASYLGLTPETLSRVRQQIAKRG